MRRGRRRVLIRPPCLASARNGSAVPLWAGTRPYKVVALCFVWHVTVVVCFEEANSLVQEQKRVILPDIDVVSMRNG